MRFRKLVRIALGHAAVVGLGLGLSGGCAGSREGAGPPRSTAEWRGADKDGLSQAELAQWYAQELLGQGGQAEEAARARRLLDKQGDNGLRAEMLRGLDDALHGRLVQAPEHFMRAAVAARVSADPDAALFADFAVQQALHFSSDTEALWKAWGKWIESAIETPRSLGFEARDRLARFRVVELWRQASGDADELAAELGGCAAAVRVAGPFGTGNQADLRVAYAPEVEPVWPAVFEADPLSGRRATTQLAQGEGCHLSPSENPPPGVYYAEAYVRLATPSKVLIDFGGALKVWVDGALVLDRDLLRFGAWVHRVAGVELSSGEHRIVARLPGGETKLRVVNADGTPSAAGVSATGGGLPSIAAPQRFEPNALARFVTARGVAVPADPLTAYVAASLSAEYGEAEVGSLLLEGLVKEPKEATGPALELAARLVERDALFGESQRRDLSDELHERAAAKDPALWSSAIHIAAGVAHAKGLIEGAAELAQLSRRFPEVPGLLTELANVYGQLGWTPEHDQVVLERAARFPGSAGALLDAAVVSEAVGDRAGAATLRARAASLDPDNGALVQRAIDAADFVGAREALRALKERRPDDKLLVDEGERIERALSADPLALEQVLEGVKHEPRSDEAWLALYDARLARQELDAAALVVAQAARAEADTMALHSARDLVDGVAPLAVYRLDGRQVIAEWEASGRSMAGMAARVLDYMAVLVHADGSSELLEHEIVRIQSEEAISRFAEQEPRPGIQLQMRVVKADGRALEPERVAEKPTLTFPHLEIGDYIETEQVMATAATGGTAYDGPQWFFREQDIGYARSEFVLVSPVHKNIEVVATGGVPEPVVTTDGYFVTQHWRMDDTPAATVEPMSVPASEYLPSLKVSWGLTLERRLRALASRVVDVDPVDPRLVRVAEAIVKPLPVDAEQPRARKLYQWVLANVQPGEELDGPRVVIGKRGNRFRAMAALCRALGIDTEWGVARNSLAPEPKTASARVAQFNNTVLRVGRAEPTWVIVDDVPYGYLPPGIRDGEAYVLGFAEPLEKVALPGGPGGDGVTYVFDGELNADGSASFRMDQTYRGVLAARLRRGLKEVAPNRVADVIETRLVGIPGARVVEHKVEGLDDVQEDLVVHVRAEVGIFARSAEGGFALEPPFAFRLGQLATLPSRKTTMLLSPGRRQAAVVRLRLPPGASAVVAEPKTLVLGGLRVAINDRVEGDVLVMDRVIELAASRITPEEYEGFAAFVRDAEDSLTRPIRVRAAYRDKAK